MGVGHGESCWGPEKSRCSTLRMERARQVWGTRPAWLEVEGEGEKPGEKSRPVHGKASQVLGRSLDFTLCVMGRRSWELPSRETKDLIYGFKSLSSK